MTGFGAGEAPLGAGVLRVELRAVNHRHLDVRVRAPEQLEVSPVIEDTLRARLGRGRIEAQARWDAAPSAMNAMDTQRVRQVYAALCALRDELNPGGDVPIEAALRAPGVFVATTQAPRDHADAAALRATELACDALTTMRIREGAALQRDLLIRARWLSEQRIWIEAERPRLLSGVRERLLARVAKLLEGTDVTVDPGRLTQEVAWFAERADVAEELTRLASHLVELERTLNARGEMVGRKLDFLMQELGREINTIGSKANDALIGQRVVDMKAELERIREQVQNIL